MGRPSLATRPQSGPGRGRTWRQYWLRDPLVGLAEHALFHALRILPLDLASAIGARAGRFRGRRLAELNRRASLALPAVAPRLAADDDARRALLARLRANAGRALVEALNTDRLCRDERILLMNHDVLARILASGRPLIFVSVHTANLGHLLGAALLQRVPYRAATTTRPLPNRYSERLSRRIRAGMDVEVVHAGMAAARTLLRHLGRPRRSLLLHLDEARGRQVRFPVFGAAPPSHGNLRLALRLARLTGALLVPAHLSRRRAGAHFFLHLAAPLDLSDPACAMDDAQAARRLDEHFSAVVRRHLDDWQQLYFAHAGEARPGGPDAAAGR